MLQKKDIHLAGFPVAITEWFYHNLDPSSIYNIFTQYLTECLSSIQNRKSFVNLLFDTFSILCLEPVQYRNFNIRRMVITGVWMVNCFFIISTLFGEITSHAAVKKPLTNYINTAEDMKERNISWIVSPNYRLDEFLVKQLPEQAKYRKVMDVTEGLR